MPRSSSTAAPFHGRIFDPRNVTSWFLFAFGAGMVNAGAVLASDTVVSHVTGNVTNAALDTSLGADLVVVIAFFLAGAMLGSFFAEQFAASPVRAFVAPVVVASGLLFVASSLGARGLFGPFGADERSHVGALVMLALLSTSMGSLNAGVAAATANQVRTTHLSGPVTDLAGNLVRAALGRGHGTKVELRWSLLRFVMLLTFALGAFVSARLAVRLEYRVFLVAAGVIGVAAALAARSLSTSVRRTEPSPVRAEARVVDLVARGSRDPRSERASRRRVELFTPSEAAGRHLP